MDTGRKGKFVINVGNIYDEVDLYHLLDGVFVTRAEFNDFGRIIEYEGLCEQFDVVPDGVVAPEYSLNMERSAFGGISAVWFSRDKPLEISPLGRAMKEIGEFLVN